MNVTQKEYLEFYYDIIKISGLDKKRHHNLEGMAFAGGTLVEHVALTSCELSLDEYVYGYFIDSNYKEQFIEATEKNDLQTIYKMKKEIADKINEIEIEMSTPKEIEIYPSDDENLILIDDPIF